MPKIVASSRSVVPFFKLQFMHRNLSWGQCHRKCQLDDLEMHLNVCIDDRYNHEFRNDDETLG